ncbi:hypothetical protein FRACYDRAFT_246367 [Fragilariopsis cylindrus CCMP1102]|uniref:Uncharacterized protein n=1 Tax=Fragilariopsis cylindrus CCMP1102 TaxID=635003 RepID=A0A1E7EZJ9_9STRA|nr:hypothetical protein FRACYDRAFT_246367 [Fragilariopsis cylindrus CCMP1102]|eukprot:OEU11254.1 hypothetical protein FRACYDRAFT_246367 [Fragilariopsis cylindrus CCMP1102]
MVGKLLLLACMLSNIKDMYQIGYNNSNTTEPFANGWNDINNDESSIIRNRPLLPKKTLTTNNTNSISVRHLIDMESAVPACSRSKCFFRSKSQNRQNNNDEGYLIARNKYHPNIYNEMKQSWEYVEQLEQTYNSNQGSIMIKHFYLEPPQLLHLDQSTLIELNSMISTRTKNINDTYYFGRRTVNEVLLCQHNASSHHYELVIQKVRPAPDHYIVLHCNEPGRMVTTFGSLRSNEQIATGTTGTTATTTTQYFNQTYLNKQMNDLQYIMKYEIKLWKDFQILIDTRGQIYHIDLDRVYQNSFWNTIQERIYEYSTIITGSSSTTNNCIKFINETSTEIIITAAAADRAAAHADAAATQNGTRTD